MRRVLYIFGLILLAGCGGQVSLFQSNEVKPYENTKFAFIMQMPESWYESAVLSEKERVVLTDVSEQEASEYKKESSADQGGLGFAAFNQLQRRMIAVYQIENPFMFECVFEQKQSYECGEIPEFRAFKTNSAPGLIEVSDQYFRHFLYFPVKKGTVLVFEYYPERDGVYDEKYYERMFETIELATV